MSYMAVNITGLKNIKMFAYNKIPNIFYWTLQ